MVLRGNVGRKGNFEFIIKSRGFVVISDNKSKKQQKSNDKVLTATFKIRNTCSHAGNKRLNRRCSARIN